MNLLLAESGATKTDWRLLANKGVVWQGQTAGFHPNTQREKALQLQLQTQLLPILPYPVDEVAFYGSAYSTTAYCLEMQALLRAELGTPKVQVEHDLLAAARAACQDSPGLVGILGTGSNSCYYDGIQLVSSFGGHGYLLGDEGSGAHLGKLFLKALLDQELPPELAQAFEMATHMPLLDFRNSIYRNPQPNVALASLTPFLLQQLAVPQVQQLVRLSFKLFLHTTLLRYATISLPVYFVGSIAEHFAAPLQAECAAAGLTIRAIIHSPIDQLVAYHLRHAA